MVSGLVTLPAVMQAVHTSMRGGPVGVATRIYSETLGICIKVGRVRDLVAEAEAARQFAFAAFAPAPK